ncbi:7136_t:CDS:2 [Diversispora eburnea]|uniref:ornithine decarboxylase n=1 Tax=Diversispora eburnea TaxID=1213867 RepID=A0A9N9BYF3_9GLOM|nr:7136_t:CDS:2 [Diversispora eburnea]
MKGSIGTVSSIDNNIQKYYSKLFNDHVLSVEEILRNHVLSLNVDSCETDGENAFFVADLGVIYRQHIRWKANLPRIEPYYAVKCNPDPILLKLLAVLGTGFDCASKSEIQTILDLGVDESRIIYANPCKQASFIRYAAQRDIRMMTFDNIDEIYKIKRYFPSALLVIRICVDDSKSICKLSPKFGAPLDTTEILLETAKSLGMEVIGVSFHVGSGCYEENIFVDAVYRARYVFDQAERLGYNFHLLDVGGGFSPAFDEIGKDNITFEKVASLLGPAIDKLFPSDVRVIAEPGRYYSASAFTIATHIIARRTTLHYINDGVYGAFNCILFDHQVVQPKVLCKGGEFTFEQEIEEPEYSCSIWGPTCDSIDCITKKGYLPELIPGDWLYFEEMGAYTICAASQFNGFKKSNIIYTTTDLLTDFALTHHAIRFHLILIIID